MKKWIIRIVVVILALGAFAGVGFAGYRVGYSHGAQVSINVENLPPIAERFDRDKMPDAPFGFGNREFPKDFGRGFGPHGFSQIHRGRGFGFFSPFALLTRVALLGLVIWLGYMIFKGNGWQLSLTRVQPVQNVQTEDSAPKKKTAKKDA